MLPLMVLAGCTENVNHQENTYHVEYHAPDYLIEHEKYLEEELFKIADH